MNSQRQPGPLIFGRKNGGRLKITGLVTAGLRAFAQAEPTSLEAGGVLVGRQIKGTRDIVVDGFSEPGPDDRRERRAFFRSKEAHQAFLDRAWAESAETAGYLGEWHTHPEPDPEPSRVDRQDWLRRLQVDTYDSPSLFFVIVGTQSILCWEGCVDSLWSMGPALNVARLKG